MTLTYEKEEKRNRVSSVEYYNRTHQQHNDLSKCFCGKFASFAISYRFGMLELLCSEHYGTHKKTKKTTNGFAKSNFKKTKEKESKEINALSHW